MDKVANTKPTRFVSHRVNQSDSLVLSTSYGHVDVMVLNRLAGVQGTQQFVINKALARTGTAIRICVASDLREFPVSPIFLSWQ